MQILLIIKSNQIKITFIVTSPQHKCLGEWNSYERAPDSAEKQQTIYIWTDSAKKKKKQFTYGQTVQKEQQQQFTYGQTVQKKQQQFTYGQTVQKEQQQQFTYGQTVQKKQQQFTYGQTVQKEQQQQFTYGQTVQKKQQQFTYGQYIFTDCTEDNVQNTHTCTQYA